ncbi:MAG: transcription antitermination factor NusB [Myxococcales bacterium]|nr:transcription antitermination factor NusB [Myxococcales bacterium]
MGSRRKAREAALQVLYQLDGSEFDADTALDLYRASFGDDLGDTDFAVALVRGYYGARERVDTAIREVSRHWRLERMARVDRNIIRLATYELLDLPEIPHRATLNEAVELAKRFGDENSPAFVNGVLDRIAESAGRGAG